MAKELILLPKTRYEELLQDRGNTHSQIVKSPISKGTETRETKTTLIKNLRGGHDSNVEEVKLPHQLSNDISTQTGYRMFVEKTSDDDAPPGIQDQPPRKRKKKTHIHWIQY